MKRGILFLSLSAALAFGSCSSEDYFAEANQGLGSTDNINGLSDVPIQLSAGGGGASRASIESDDAGNFEISDSYLHIFCLAHESRVPGLEVDYTTRLGAHISGVAANAVKTLKSGAQGTTASDYITHIQFVDSAGYYYPLDDSYRYAFYGYYPRQHNVTRTADAVVVNSLAIDGKTDIIWGSAIPADNTEAYSADYCRANPDVTPNMTFEHLLMRLAFKYKSNKTDNVTWDELSNWTIYGVTITRVPKSGKLFIALRDNPDLPVNERLAVDFESQNPDDWTSRVVLDTYGNEAARLPLGQSYTDAAGYALGDTLLLPVPPANSTFDYQMEVTLWNKQTGKTVTSSTMNIATLSGVTYERGKTYAVLLNISGPSLIQISATLEGWEDYDNGTGSNIIGNIDI